MSMDVKAKNDVGTAISEGCTRILRTERLQVTYSPVAIRTVLQVFCE